MVVQRFPDSKSVDKSNALKSAAFMNLILLFPVEDSKLSKTFEGNFFALTQVNFIETRQAFECVAGDSLNAIPVQVDLLQVPQIEEVLLDDEVNRAVRRTDSLQFCKHSVNSDWQVANLLVVVQHHGCDLISGWGDFVPKGFD